MELIYDYGYETQILAASVRHTMHIVNCAKIGADVMKLDHFLLFTDC
jgi:transaldolase